MHSYSELESVFSRYRTLCDAAAVLQWDSATMMPPLAGEDRGRQLAMLAEVSHEAITSPRMEELFANAEAQIASLDTWQRSNLREMKREWQHGSAVQVRLVKALTMACHESELFWRTARKENNFKGFIPYLEKVLGLVRESAQAKADAMNLEPYDALLDSYDPGMRSAVIGPLFDDLGVFLPDFLAAVRNHQAEQKPAVEITDAISAIAQKALGMKFMQKFGFDFARGRLDESVHPFCGGVPGDIRITARYNENDFLSGFFAVMHETGHALYEMGLPVEWRSQPVGTARGMGMHESQSLFAEKQLCISLDFLHYAVPLIRESFAVSGPAWTPENIYRLMTRVEPSLIRVEADEVTYPAHIILRYRLERQLIGETLCVKDLPDAWRAQMQELLGITPDSDANGCMQDIHWPHGSFGYFPSYTLGAMIAAQLSQAVRKALPDLSAQIRNGEFRPLWEWLRTNVHSQGSKLSTTDLIRHTTGKELDASCYKEHLRNRYLAGAA